MKCNSIITIGRQFGSGGRIIGKALAEKLDVKFYDKELISLAAKESGISPEVFAEVDERATNSLLYSLSMGLYNSGAGAYSPVIDMPVNDKLYLLQHKIIKRIAEEPCVIVGRCADYVLRENKKLISIYIHADFDYRVKQAIKLHDVPKDKAEQVVNKTDKTRANYYKFYSDRKWGDLSNYDLCIKSGVISNEKVVDILYDYVLIRENNKL